MISVTQVPGYVLVLILNACLADSFRPDSVRSAARTVAAGVMGYYTGDVNGAIGIFPDPYYWWEAGAVWGAMVDYWYLTGDDQYNDVVSEALQSQVGPNANYMPPNQTRTLVRIIGGLRSLRFLLTIGV